MADTGVVEETKSLKPKFVIEEINLIVCRVAITNEIYLETQVKLNRGAKAKYQFPRTACYGPTQVLRGLTELNVRLFHGPRPYALIVFFVKSTAANGSYQLNPQQTSHLDTIDCCAYFNSYQYPQPLYRPDFGQPHVAPLYNALLKVWNVNKIYNCGFSITDFLVSQTYFAFPMDPNGSVDTASSVPPVGDVLIKFRFGKETDQTYNMYWYVISHATVAIDASRVVTMNYIAEKPHFGLRANSTICFSGPASSDKTTLITALIKQQASIIPNLGPIKKLLAVPEEVVKEFQRCQELQSNQLVNDLLTAEHQLTSSDTYNSDLSPEERKTQIASLLEWLSTAQHKFASLYKNEGVIATPGDMDQEPALSGSNKATTMVMAMPTAVEETFAEKPKPLASLIQRMKTNLAEEKKALSQALPRAKKLQRTMVDTQPPPSTSSSSLIPINSQQSPALIPINYPSSNPHMMPSMSSSTAAASIARKESKQPMAKSRSNFEGWTPQRLARDRQPPDRLGNYAQPKVRKQQQKKVD
uniref:Uncharacterized protein n=1 Tax=Plectus sambesii TaxID=2011161 RepID=A0A914VSN5_9BILA